MMMRILTPLQRFLPSRGSTQPRHGLILRIWLFTLAFPFLQLFGGSPAIHLEGHLPGVLRSVGVIPARAAGALPDERPRASGKDQRVYLPIVNRSSRSAPVILGVYSHGWLGDPKTIENELDSLGEWSGKRLSLAANFMGIELPDYSIHVVKQLSLIWGEGYTPFINLMTDHSAASIARGNLDWALRAWGRAFNEYAQGGQRMAFIAPLPEMNGDWVSYGKDPTNFILAYRRIQDIFADEGVPARSVQWVFAPNADHLEPGFEVYYPGDMHVDAIGFSSYNFGYCPAVEWHEWLGPEALYEPYIERVNLIAPDKPIFISQTGTTSFTSGGHSVDATNAWLYDTYNYLAFESDVVGVIYFNLQGNCDFRIFIPGNLAYQGYADGVANPSYQYLSPQDLINNLR